MTRTGHCLLGASCALAFGLAARWSMPVALAGAAIAAVTAPLPDVDQRGWWKRSLGQFRAFAHRRLTHWWGLPTAGAVLAYDLPTEVRWIAAAMLIGWSSHLLGDWVFGKRGPACTGWRRAGIPIAPWWAYHGLGVKAGGKCERFAAWPLLALTLAAEAALMIGV